MSDEVRVLTALHQELLRLHRAGIPLDFGGPHVDWGPAELEYLEEKMLAELGRGRQLVDIVREGVPGVPDLYLMVLRNWINSPVPSAMHVPCMLAHLAACYAQGVQQRRLRVAVTWALASLGAAYIAGQVLPDMKLDPGFRPQPQRVLAGLQFLGESIAIWLPLVWCGIGIYLAHGGRRLHRARQMFARLLRSAHAVESSTPPGATATGAAGGARTSSSGASGDELGPGEEKVAGPAIDRESRGGSAASAAESPIEAGAYEALARVCCRELRFDWASWMYALAGGAAVVLVGALMYGPLVEMLLILFHSS
ncbi:MAG: hypothetical protein D6753_09075 [Planctomycetota bacterium]|nr:MAG: hypothetical protein D6753_09075 [Planctomycetota bacterium]